MKELKRLKIFLCLVMIFTVIAMPLQTNVYAASGNYKTLYRSFLKKKTVTVTVKYDFGGEKGSYKEKVALNYFNLIDIDKNGVKELVVESELYATNYYVFGIKSGKVVYLGEIRKGGGDSFCYNKSQKGLVALYGGSGASGKGFWQMKKGKLKETVELYAFFNYKTTYEHNYKKCSSKVYNYYYNKYFKQSNLKMYKFVKKNNTNIKKLLA